MFSFIIPFEAIIVVKAFFLFEDIFLRTLALSCKKIFLSSLLYFLSTKNVTPVNESLNCCAFTVGKNEVKLSFPKICLDLFKAKGVIKDENINKKLKLLQKIKKII